MTPIIFLDFDGVLNSHEFWLLDPLNSKRLDPFAIERISWMCMETGAEVVVSSAWRKDVRHEDSLPYVQGCLAGQGFTGRVVGVTPRDLLHPKSCPLNAHSECERGHEIECWMNAAGVTKDRIVIFDDNSDMGSLKDRLIQTEYTYGLQDWHVEKAIQMLRTKE